MSTSAGSGVANAAPVARPRSPRALMLERLRRDRMGMASLMLALVILLACFVGGPVLSRALGHGPNDLLPYAVDDLNRPVGPMTRVVALNNATYDEWGDVIEPRGAPTTLLVLGADGALGRDLLLRILYGGVVSITVGVLAVAIALLIGVTAGAAAALLGGAVDGIVSRVTELAMALPVLFLLVLIGTSALGERMQGITFGVFNQGVVAVALFIGLFMWFYPARLVRTQVIVLRQREFVDAAVMAGAGRWRIFRTHLVPHLVPALAAWATTALGVAILFEIGVSFLNAGVELPTASWGRLLVDTWGSPFAPGRFDQDLASVWPTVFTSLAIFLTVVAVYELGEALQRAVLVERRR